MLHHFRNLVLGLALLAAACTEVPLEVAQQPEATPSPAYSVSSSATVSTTADAGAGSLRQAILDATPGATTTIGIAPSLANQTIILAGELSISGKHIIIDASPNTIILDGNDATRVFNVAADGTLDLTNVIVQRGRAAPAGGGILNAGTATLNNVTVRTSYAERTGGGIQNTGVLTLVNSVVRDNRFYESNWWHTGAGLYSGAGTVTSTNTSYMDNRIADNTGEGAGIRIDGGVFYMKGGVISASPVQYAAQNGAGLMVGLNGTAFVDSILVQNTRVAGPYGPIYVNGTNASLTITRSFLRFNTVQSNGGVIYLKRGSLVANYNRFSANNAAKVEQGNADFNNNYWNCNQGPNGPGSCAIGTNITPDNWLIVGIKAAPSAIDPLETSAITLDVTKNSADQPIALSKLHTMLGLQFNFVSTTKGSMSPTSVTLNSSGQAAATFTSNGETGLANVNARLYDPYSVSPPTSSIQIQVGALNSAPVANAGDDQTVQCTGATTPVTLNGTATDPDGNALVYTWRQGNTDVFTGATFTPQLALGAHTFTLRVSDGTLSADDDVTINVIDTQAPAITLNGDAAVSVELGSGYSDAGASAADACAGSVPVQAIGTVNTNQVGNYTVTYTATDASGNTASAERTVTVIDTHAPVITLNGSALMTLERGVDSYSEPGATATDASGPITVQISGTVNTNVAGTYTITYSAQDPVGNSSTASRTVQVVDTQAPVITVGAAPLVIWPPNHSYVTVSLAALGISVSEGSAGDVAVSKVTSDEPDNGLGDGDTAIDMVISPDGRSVQLRAERSGKGNGRVYVVHLSLADAAGNIGSATYRVSVPKTQKQAAVMDAVMSQVVRQP